MDHIDTWFAVVLIVALSATFGVIKLRETRPNR